MQRLQTQWDQKVNQINNWKSQRKTPDKLVQDPPDFILTTISEDERDDYEDSYEEEDAEQAELDDYEEPDKRLAEKIADLLDGYHRKKWPLTHVLALPLVIPFLISFSICCWFSSTFLRRR